jgi:signal-transduction protein with cAMP-binding, CBS, and nucleotidyltransferase domain
MQIREVMTSDPIVCEADTKLTDVATMMRDEDIGTVLVQRDGALCGIATDRDLVVRGMAEGQDPRSLKLGDVCSGDIRKVDPTTDVDEVVKMMSTEAIRRIAVVEGSRPVGIVSIGDLAERRDPNSALGHISAAPPNN